MSGSGSVHVEIAVDSLDVEALRDALDLSGCGSVVSFVGVTRDMDDGIEVERLEFDAWEEQLPAVLHQLGERRVCSSEFIRWHWLIGQELFSWASQSLQSTWQVRIAPKVSPPVSGSSTN